MKTCKQCGRCLDDASFQRYAPRGTGAYHTSPGLHTLCKECEAFNRAVDRAYKAELRTGEQQELVDEATKIYKSLISRGLQPRGALARAISGIGPHNIGAAQRARGKALAQTYNALIGPEIKLQEMIEAPLPTTSASIAKFKEDYELYEDMLYEIMEGHISPAQEKLLTQVSARMREFEQHL